LVTYNINRGGEITNPPAVTITTRNLITVLPINNAAVLPITGTPEQCQHPKKYARGTWRKQQRLRKYSLEFCALARVNDLHKMTAKFKAIKAIKAWIMNPFSRHNKTSKKLSFCGSI
jgi:hypothetical protein